jgi:hypothetical protein
VLIGVSRRPLEWVQMGVEMAYHAAR